ncbi:XRE family transcriptional regulator [Pseudonocardiaceae bacterium YIM PH 21723]|nr:XRE family transcriptional regulator [Pseudonocardiaceae bacterium YIM PH 21723]
MDIEDRHIGTRVREIRTWRGMTLEETAGLAGISFGYLGQLERGLKPVSTRRVLEALAWALRVAPSELTMAPWTFSDTTAAHTHGSVVQLEEAMEATELGEDPGVPVRDWAAIAADVRRLVDLMHISADYSAQGEMAPGLLFELHGAYVRYPQHRREVLLGLIHAYSSTAWLTKRFGRGGTPTLAARLAQKAAQRLELPQWLGYAAWLRCDAAGGLSRKTQYKRAVETADQLSGTMNDPEVVQSAGMLHLSAALAAASLENHDDAQVHLSEASELASRMDSPVGTFAHMWFGTANVGVWTTSIHTEWGEGGKVAEIAAAVPIEAIPSPSRKAEFFADWGRSLMTERATSEKGLKLLLQAEELAPQRIRRDVFVREAVSDSLRMARRDAGGRELRGLAWRMGISPQPVTS